MKKAFLAFIILGMALPAAVSQDCPYGYDFTSQWLIDNFQDNYPGCTEIQGSVVIKGDDITNLEGLSVLTSIDGILYIGISGNGCPNLESLNGLRNLQSISGILQIESCDKLSDLTGLEHLDTVCCGVDISFNDNLRSLNGLNGLKHVNAGFGIFANNRLRTLDGLDSLQSVEYYLDILSNDSLVSLDGLESLQSVNHGGLKIQGNNILENIGALQNLTYVGNELSIELNPLLPSLHGLEGLDSIPDGLFISQNLTLFDLTGLENLFWLGGDLEIMYNFSLTSLEALQNLTAVNGDLRVSFNPVLPNLAGLDKVDTTGINIIDINNNNLLSTCNVKSICDYLSVPNAINEISGNATGCANEAEVIQACNADVREIGDILPVSVYPNPAGSVANCQFLVSDYSEISISIIDLQGREITGIKYDPLNAGPQSLNLNVSGIVPGIYLVCIVSGTNQQYAREKLAVVH